MLLLSRQPLLFEGVCGVKAFQKNRLRGTLEGSGVKRHLMATATGGLTFSFILGRGESRLGKKKEGQMGIEWVVMKH